MLQEGQHPLTGQRAASFRLLANYSFSLQIWHSKFADDIILWRNLHLRFIISWYGLCTL